MSNYPRPITDYTVDEVETIVLKAIRDQQMTAGYYYDTATNQSLTITDRPGMTRIAYQNGFYEHTFYADTLTNKTIPA